MREARPGVWYWQSPHPDWDEHQSWPELVSSYAVELGDDFLLSDPLSVSDELHERATAVVLTAPYHERDARRLGLPVHTPPADTWQDWVEKFGVEPDRVRGMESEDLAWLRAGEGEGHLHAPGAWPFGITAYAGREDNDLILWLPSVKAVVTGDTLSDFGDGLDVQLGGRKPRAPSRTRTQGTHRRALLHAVARSPDLAPAGDFPCRPGIVGRSRDWTTPMPRVVVGFACAPHERIRGEAVTRQRDSGLALVRRSAVGYGVAPVTDAAIWGIERTHARGLRPAPWTT